MRATSSTHLSFLELYSTIFYFRSYDFERNESIVTAFEEFSNYLSEDAIWEMSEKLKPRGTNNRKK